MSLSPKTTATQPGTSVYRTGFCGYDRLADGRLLHRGQESHAACPTVAGVRRDVVCTCPCHG